MTLGDRIKRYEESSHHVLVRRMPVMIRVDGRAFHTFTRFLNKPFDKFFIDTMTHSAMTLSKEMQGFKVAYIQSDEASFCITDYDTVDTQGWFDYDQSKIVSISAAVMSSAFNLRCLSIQLPVFDSRAFNVPVDDVVNAFLWRAKDWERNSLQMYCRSFFSHKELHGKNHSDMHEMLHGIGKNWTTDLTEQQRNGTFIIGSDERHDILPSYESINNAIGHLFKMED